MAVHTHPSIPCPICGFGAEDPQKCLEEQKIKNTINSINMNLTKKLRDESFTVMVDDHVSMDDVPEQVISLHKAKEVTQEYVIAILHEYTGMDYKACKSLMERMDDYMNHPEHKPQGEDPGY